MRTFLSLFVWPALLVQTAIAIGQKATIGFDGGSGNVLASKQSYAQLIADAGDWPGVLRAANDLAIDFGRVTGLNGSLELRNSTHSPQNASVIFTVSQKSTFALPAPKDAAKGGVIIVGTIGKSSLIDDLVSSGKLSVSGVKGHWEAFTSTVVSQPIAGVSQALVIAGTYTHTLFSPLIY